MKTPHPNSTILQRFFKNHHTLKKIEEAGKSGRSITNVLENVHEPDTINVETEKNPNNLKILK